MVVTNRALVDFKSLCDQVVAKAWEYKAHINTKQPFCDGNVVNSPSPPCFSRQGIQKQLKQAGYKLQMIINFFFFLMKRNALVSLTGSLIQGSQKRASALQVDFSCLIQDTDPRLLQQKGAPLLRSQGPWRAAYHQCAMWQRASTQRMPWWLCTRLPSADSVKG